MIYEDNFNEGVQTLTKHDIENALSRLSELARDNERMIDIAMYGGATIMLTWDMRMESGNVDTIVMDATHNEFVKASVIQIAQEMSLHEDWLNDAVKGFISKNEIMDKLPLLTEWEEGGLRIYVSTAEYLLAMKCLSMRWNLTEEEKGEREDIKILLQKMDIKSAETVYDIVEKYYPSNLINPRVTLGIRVLLEEINQKNTVSSHTVYPDNKTDIKSDERKPI